MDAAAGLVLGFSPFCFSIFRDCNVASRAQRYQGDPIDVLETNSEPARGW